MAQVRMTIHERPFGRLYEDFEPGDVYRHWPGKTITEADDHLFCMLTMNHHPLHIDAWYAENETQFGKNVVVGNLVYSLVLGMSVPDVSGAAIANLEIESLQHKRPTSATPSTPRPSSSRSANRRVDLTAASSPSRAAASTSGAKRSASPAAR
jgi:acyl dehydratase